MVLVMTLVDNGNGNDDDDDAVGVDVDAMAHNVLSQSRHLAFTSQNANIFTNCDSKAFLFIICHAFSYCHACFFHFQFLNRCLCLCHRVAFFCLFACSLLSQVSSTDGL